MRLTKLQRLLIAFIVNYWRENYEMPSLRTLAGHFKFSVQGIGNHINRLVEMGILEYKNPAKKRGLHPTWMMVKFFPQDFISEDELHQEQQVQDED